MSLGVCVWIMDGLGSLIDRTLELGEAAHLLLLLLSY